MNEILAEKVIRGLAAKDSLDALFAFLDYKIEFYKNQLVDSQTWEYSKECQGAIKSLNSMKRIRDDCVGFLSSKDK